jgi:hypothetical protein
MIVGFAESRVVAMTRQGDLELWRLPALGYNLDQLLIANRSSTALRVAIRQKYRSRVGEASTREELTSSTRDCSRAFSRREDGYAGYDCRLVDIGAIAFLTHGRFDECHLPIHSLGDGHVLAFHTLVDCARRRLRDRRMSRSGTQLA